MDELLIKSLEAVAEFYDERKVGDIGPLGFRRSTDLKTLLACAYRLLEDKILVPHSTTFLDLGCADGRVNVFLSYLSRVSVGIELDEWTLDEYDTLRSELEEALESKGLLVPQGNIFLFHGDATDEDVHRKIAEKGKVRLDEIDIFYTYLVMHDEFARLIAEKGKKGALFLVYGLQSVLPKYKGLSLLDDISPLEGILGVYRKE
ncbi:MAG: hypothetical protein V2J25_02550 [Desulfatiglans sp.]|jgi:hypothetical protein|nr:hypothetical protein [Thermodesulfobacteriota bacterium]MEE4351725.1 hypothetical protein [Desulfatiglans sp.]